MRFSVSVPVLSAQMTVVAPRLSTADRRRTSMPAPHHPLHAERQRRGGDRGQALGHGGDGQRDGACAPSRAAARRAGAPRPRAAAQARARRRPDARPSASSWRSSGVGGDPVSGDERAHAGRSRCGARSRSPPRGRAPSTTRVPAYTMLSRSPSAPVGRGHGDRLASRAGSPRSAPTGRRRGRSTSRRRASAATSGPGRSTSTSPGTSAAARPAIVSSRRDGRPPRRGRARQGGQRALDPALGDR